MKKLLLLPFVFPLAINPCTIAIGQDKPYFQQEVNYKINVALDDTKHDLNGDETIEYINNSPDELTFIWFHIWPNAYKNNHTALAKQLIEDGNKKFYFAGDQERGWIDGLDFKANGQKIKTENHPDHIDVIKLILNEPLKPGSKTFITTPFHVHIPIGAFSRLGHIEQQYQITQWYPKPAVYDKFGWHPMPYLNQGEFYSEYGSFDVSITLPKNYVVGSTGILANGEEETAWLMKKAEETKAIDQFNPANNKFPPSSSEMKTLRYQASHVHDFAFFADKRYHVMHDEVVLPHSKNKVDTWVMFTPSEGKLWKKAAKYVSDAVYYYSLWNGDYPYPHATAVDGALSAGGGMEYPMITVIGEMGSDESLDRVIAHEVGHNWFYGILGSNERDHAWMDEGVNSFNENRYMQTKYRSDSSKVVKQQNLFGLPFDVGKLMGIPNLDESTLFDLGYRFNAAQKKDQPCDIHSGEYTSVNYGLIVYGKTSVILAFLQEYLGKDLYDKCAQKYFDTWKFKHPYPEDMKKVFEEVSGKDLGWFFTNMIPTTNRTDYKICSAENDGTERKEMKVKVNNRGKINSPFSISALKDGKIIATQWYEGFEGVKTVDFLSQGPYDQLKIDAQNKMPDVNRQNNNFKIRGLCKKTEPLNLKMMGMVRNTNKTQLFWMPVMGWNNYNKFMLGAAVYNNVLPEKKFEYVFMPMYAFGSKDLAGGASVHYNMHFEKIFQTVRFGFNASRYSYTSADLPKINYNKIAPELLLEIRKKHLRSTIKQTIHIRQVNVWKEVAIGNYSFAPALYHYDTVTISINDLTYRINNTRKINPYSVALNVQRDTSFVKISITADYSMTFKKKNKSLDIRFFGGKMMDTPGDGNYFLYTSDGGYTTSAGTHDYMYDHVFFGRSETDGFLSHQFAETEGSMKVYTPLGRSSDWLAAVNIKCPMPGKFPFKLFADMSFLPSSAALNETMIWDAGIYIPLVKNVVEIYIPVLVSRDIKDVFYLNNPDLKDQTPDKNDPDKFLRIARMIRFTFNINRMNPFELVRNLDI